MVGSTVKVRSGGCGSHTDIDQGAKQRHVDERRRNEAGGAAQAGDEWSDSGRVEGERLRQRSWPRGGRARHTACGTAGEKQRASYARMMPRSDPTPGRTFRCLGGPRVSSSRPADGRAACRAPPLPRAASAAHRVPHPARARWPARASLGAPHGAAKHAMGAWMLWAPVSSGRASMLRTSLRTHGTSVLSCACSLAECGYACP